MMRLGRRASLLVALYLLTSAATAYAECAWVLWEGSGQDSQAPYREPGRWRMKEAAPTAKGCETLRDVAMKQRKDGIDTLRKQIPPDKRNIPYNEVLDPDSLRLFNWFSSLEYTCLPDTVDPRGPKGK